MENDECSAVMNLRNYLRIKTEQPIPDYETCGNFLHKLCIDLGLEWRTYEVVKGKPFFIMTLHGTNPSLPSLMLYSHTDVVPADKEKWMYDPYSGHKDDNGKIFGRGAQDMKSVGMQYLEALRQLINDGHRNFLRNIHLVWGPDEEIGSIDGMSRFVDEKFFKELNIGFALDEGLPSEDDTFKVFYGERCAWWLEITCRGQPGHGSRLLDNTAAEKFNNIINSMLTFREEQKMKLLMDPQQNLGNVISVNLTKVEGGVQVNVVPTELKAWFDIRVPPTVDFEQFENQIKSWCNKAGSDVSYNFLIHSKIKNVTPTTVDDPWWKAFSSALSEEKCLISKEIFIGGTDSRFLREKGYRAIGFTAINNTPVLLHDHNEYIDESVYLRGIKIYERLIMKLANLSEYN